MAISWECTFEKFGYMCGNLPSHRPRVICLCDDCGKEKTISIRVKSKIINNQMAYRCPSCVSLSRKELISSQLKGQWAKASYIQARSNSSKLLWSDDVYRKKQLLAVQIAMEKVDMKSILKERYKDPKVKDRLRIISTQLWNDESHRLKHKSAMNRPEIKLIISKAAIKSWKDEEYRLRMAEVRSQMSGMLSSIQSKLYELLDGLGVDYYPEGPQTRIGYYVFDCLIQSKMILVECQGDYWHSLSNAQSRDKQKFTYIKKYFPQYKIVYIWEREFYQVDRVTARLKSLLGIERILKDFNFNEVKILRADNIKNFLELYHYIGPGRGGIKYGAFLGGELIAVAVFSKPLRQNSIFGQDALECSRFCIHPSYQKKNFGSWFLSRCTKLFRNMKIYSYADATVGHTGSIYKAAGWTHHHTVPPDYWYMDKDGYIMHKKTLYNRAINLKFTENEFAFKYGYQKIVGGPKECFVYDKNVAGVI